MGDTNNDTQCVVVCWSVFYNVMPCVAVCCRSYELTRSPTYEPVTSRTHAIHGIACASPHQNLVRGCAARIQYVGVCCCVLQCAAVCCSVLQYVAVCHSVLQWVAIWISHVTHEPCQTIPSHTHEPEVSRKSESRTQMYTWTTHELGSVTHIRVTI